MTPARPFLKWAGGKTQLVDAILERLPERMETYFEPFLGGGAVFFALAEQGRFRRAVLADNNPDLVDAWRGVQKHVQEVIDFLAFWRHDARQFYELRKDEHRERSLAYRAARVIYLNKTCYNGLWRVNASGKFNVPFGRYKNPTICDAANLRAASEALRNVKIELADFETAVEAAGEVDGVYFDPPYLPVSRTANFTRYSAGAFGDEEHQRLASVFGRLGERGVGVVLSNSDVPRSRELFARFQTDAVRANRNINSKANGRGPVSELLVRAGAGAGAPLRRSQSRAAASL